jgi:hypothetical protein
VRDLDGLLEHLDEELAELEEPDRAHGRVLAERLRADREEARRTLVTALGSDSYRLLLTRLRLPPRLAAEVDAVPLRTIAQKKFRRLRRTVEKFGKHPDDAALHRLRIRLKRARYAAGLAAVSGTDGKRFFLTRREGCWTAQSGVRVAAGAHLPTHRLDRARLGLVARRRERRLEVGDQRRLEGLVGLGAGDEDVEHRPEGRNLLCRPDPPLWDGRQETDQTAEILFGVGIRFDHWSPDDGRPGFLPSNSLRSLSRQREILLAIVPWGMSSSSPIVR